MELIVCLFAKRIKPYIYDIDKNSWFHFYLSEMRVKFSSKKARKICGRIVTDALHKKWMS